jgi:hypothetical protein
VRRPELPPPARSVRTHDHQFGAGFTADWIVSRFFQIFPRNLEEITMREMSYAYG